MSNGRTRQRLKREREFVDLKHDNTDSEPELDEDLREYYYDNNTESNNYSLLPSYDQYYNDDKYDEYYDDDYCDEYSDDHCDENGMTKDEHERTQREILSFERNFGNEITFDQDRYLLSLPAVKKLRNELPTTLHISFPHSALLSFASNPSFFTSSLRLSLSYRNTIEVSSTISYSILSTLSNILFTFPFHSKTSLSNFFTTLHDSFNCICIYVNNPIVKPEVDYNWRYRRHYQPYQVPRYKIREQVTKRKKDEKERIDKQLRYFNALEDVKRYQEAALIKHQLSNARMDRKRRAIDRFLSLTIYSSNPFLFSIDCSRLTTTQVHKIRDNLNKLYPMIVIKKTLLRKAVRELRDQKRPKEAEALEKYLMDNKFLKPMFVIVENNISLRNISVKAHYLRMIGAMNASCLLFKDAKGRTIRDVRSIHLYPEYGKDGPTGGGVWRTRLKSLMQTENRDAVVTSNWSEDDIKLYTNDFCYIPYHAVEYIPDTMEFMFDSFSFCLTSISAVQCEVNTPFLSMFVPNRESDLYEVFYNRGAELGINDYLPREVLLCVLQTYLEAQKAKVEKKLIRLMEIGRVCKIWRELIDTNGMWKELYKSKWGGWVDNVKMKSWKTTFMKRWKHDKKSGVRTKNHSSNYIENCGNENCSGEYWRPFCGVCKKNITVIHNNKLSLAELKKVGGPVVLVYREPVLKLDFEFEPFSSIFGDDDDTGFGLFD
eukprot:TRINITY_DN7751_c0_g1_i1.p1 TRINITY_DN7751_c0_g1~~TRINITY_DN7751_c0_g1_i1.p1  ORF type:complete len:714 (-),score=106.35 TRINITY_DN7751_c0_g1_i1:19-2160(-)